MIIEKVPNGWVVYTESDSGITQRRIDAVFNELGDLTDYIHDYYKGFENKLDNKGE